MLPTREGVYHAYPVEIGIDETGPNHLATCIIRFALYEELQPDGQWADCAAEHWEITGYFYLERRDGSLNTLTLDSLKAALGWDGRDPFWLQETDLSERPVQVRLGLEEYAGRTRIKVQYIARHGSTANGSVSKADDATRRRISTRLGAKVRATAGPTHAPAKPATPAGPPKLPPAAPPPKPEPAPPAKPEPAPPAEPAATMGAAWQAFCAGYESLGDRGSPEDRERQWFSIIAKLFPGKQPYDLSETEWAAMRDQGPAHIVPF